MIIEFALIAGPFFVLLGGIIELAILMLASNSLQSAVQVAGQDLDRGVITADAGAFRHAVCEQLPSMLSCDNSLTIDVDSVPSWETFDGDTMIVESFPSDAATTDLFVRASYLWPTIFPSAILGLDLQNQQGSFLLAATAVVR